MVVFCNGRYLREDRAWVSASDRGFLYGDGLFETILVQNGLPFRWLEHWERLEHGAGLLRIPLGYSSAELREATCRLAEENQLPQALVRLTVSRGTGPRGYSAKGAGPANVILALHPWHYSDRDGPPQWRLRTASLRLQAGDPLAAVKSTSKLLQVMARMEAEARGAEEALLLNGSGQVAEATSGNLFWVAANKVYTPPVAAGGLAGITRRVLLDLCGEQGHATEEIMTNPARLLSAQGVFLTLTSYGIIEVIELDGTPLSRSPLIPMLFQAYWESVRQACRVR